MNWVKMALTARDNTTWDALPIFGCLGLVMFIVFTGAALWLDHTSWNPLTYGTGFGGLLAAVGGSIRLRDGLDTSTQSQTTTSVEQTKNPTATLTTRKTKATRTKP